MIAHMQETVDQYAETETQKGSESALIDLLACPLCAGHPSIEMGDEGGYYVSCPDCYLVLGESYGMSASRAIGVVNLGMFEEGIDAVRAWNKRAK